MVALAGSIGAAMLGALYAAGAPVEAPASVEGAPAVAATSPRPEPIPEGLDASEEMLAGDVDPDVEIDIGPLTLVPRAEPRPRPRRSATAPAARPAARSRDAAPPIAPRLHADPGQHVIATARRMIARDETVEGSCYRYLSEVYARAGHAGWRSRRIVHREGRLGPYADLDLIRPGDWLYIVNHPDRTPVGTHSVLFVSWEDRARGYARVIEHSGWGSPSAGQERPYDVSRTYRIIRPILAR